jgi:hypothetical protein
LVGGVGDHDHSQKDGDHNRDGNERTLRSAGIPLGQRVAEGKAPNSPKQGHLPTLAAASWPVVPPLIIRLIIQTIRWDRSQSVAIDVPSNL